METLKLDISPGKYVIAVSGGVDSMVFLDMLAHTPGLELIVAHFEHGIRADSDQDRQLVEQAAANYNLPFTFERGNLGPTASEAIARRARYKFLRHVKKRHKARAIITAHHQDDLIETAIINMLRGTGRKGLASLQSTPEVIRPLLRVTKAQLYQYASAHPNITWNEDSTNNDTRYLRNYVRKYITKNLEAPNRQLFLDYVQKAMTLNLLIDTILPQVMSKHMQNDSMERRWFIGLPHEVSGEVMVAWLRQHNVREFDKKTVERLVAAAKVLTPGRIVNVNAGYWLKAGKAHLYITRS